MDISKLADMADKVMEVATPTVSAIADASFERIEAGEMKKLREDVARLTDLVASLQTDRRRKSRRTRSPAPPRAILPSTHFVGITLNMEARLKNIVNPAVGKTIRLVTSGDRCRRPKFQSPILC